MVWIYEVLEVCDRQQRPLGRFRLVRWPSEKPDKLQGLCEHAHPNVDEALCCPDANRIVDHEFRERIVPDKRPLQS